MNIKKSKNEFSFLVTSLFLFIFLFSLVSAEVKEIGPFKQNTRVSLTQVCDNCTFVNVTIVQLPRDAGRVIINSGMTKNGQNYNYSFAQTSTLGDYDYTTCGNPDGVLTCETIAFTVTPSGNINFLGFSILIILGLYTITFVGFFGRNAWISLFGGMALIPLGLFTLLNGIDIFRNTATEIFSWTTIGVGSFISLFTATEIVRENM